MFAAGILRRIGRQAVRPHFLQSYSFPRAVMAGEPSPAAHARAHSYPHKRKHAGGQNPKTKKQKKDTIDLKDGLHDSVLFYDVQQMLQKLSVQKEHGPVTASQSPPERDAELELSITELSSTGDGLAYHSPSEHVMVVPYTAPGDVVKARVSRFGSANHSFTDLMEIITPSSHRDDTLVRCPYFAKCSGCQLQMLPYEYQLQHKKAIVEKAYRNFSDLEAEQVPAVEDTIGSPLQYGYRTKLTPHFDGPPGKRSDRRNGIHHAFKEVPAIGFMPKGSRKTLDIEDCPIATDAVRKGNKRERKRVADELHTYKRGATLLLRESTRRVPKSHEVKSDGAEHEPLAIAEDDIVEEHLTHRDIKSCITDSNAETTEYIEDFTFTNRAGAFFQNNNSILPVFTRYIRDLIKTSPSAPQPAEAAAAAAAAAQPRQLNYLIDAYCGSGLFSIVLAPLFTKTLGIDIATSSIESAARNASLNAIPASRASFVCADATDLFSRVAFPPAETVVVIDPPRKGCDRDFLRQLAEFGPERVVYVSCNVHTQARDVGMLVGGVGEGGARYEIESLRGFDFFPQTGHVEGVGVLRRVHEATGS